MRETGSGNLFVAIIADIKDSRYLEERKEVQEKLREVLDSLNRKYENDIAAKFLITLGDEFQGLLRGGENVLNIIEEIKMSLYPVRIRFGIGIGSISTDINEEMALGADGPAYYCAREAVEVLKDREKKKKAVLADICLRTAENDRGKEVLVNTVFELMYVVENGWTKRQREIIWDMLLHQDGQKNTASRLRVSQPTVQKALASGNYYTYENALKNVAEILGDIRYD